MSLPSVFLPQLLLLLLSLVCHCHSIRADDPTALADGQPAQQLLPPNGTAYFTYSHFRSTDSSLYLGLSKDSFSGALSLYLSWPDQPVNSTYFAYQLLVDEGADSSSTVYSVQPANYTLLLVNADSTNNATATLVASSRTVLAVPNTEPVAGSCLVGGPLYYSVDLPTPIDNDVILYIQPSNRASLQYEHGLSLYITHGKLPSAANATWSYPTLHWNETAAIQRDDPALAACTSPCTLYLSVDCVGRQPGVQYRLTTQEALGLLTVQPNERLPAIQATTAKHYQLFLTNPPTLYISIELCDGDVSAYLSTTTPYPTTPADSVAYWTRPNSAPTFVLGGGALQNYTEYYLNVVPTMPSTIYELTVLQYDPAPLAPLVAPSSTALTQATSGSVRFIPPTIASHHTNQSGLDIVYFLYLLDDSHSRPGRITYTLCGLRHSATHLYAAFQSRLARQEDGTSQLTWAENDWPATANLVAFLFNHSAAEDTQVLTAYPLLYTATTIPAASDQTVPESNRQAVVVAEVIASIFLPLFFLACAVAMYLRWRTSKLETELRLELPDVEANGGGPANSAERRQQRRQRERQAAEQVTRVRDTTSTNRSSLLSDDSLSRY